MLKNLVKKFKSFMKEEKGDFGVKGIAVTVAVIVVIGAVVAAVTTFANDWVTQIWNMFIGFIEDTLM